MTAWNRHRACRGVLRREGSGDDGPESSRGWRRRDESLLRKDAATGCSLIELVRNSLRPRCSRDMTVPIGQSVMSCLKTGRGCTRRVSIPTARSAPHRPCRATRGLQAQGQLSVGAVQCQAPSPPTAHERGRPRSVWPTPTPDGFLTIFPDTAQPPASASARPLQHLQRLRSCADDTSL